MFSSHFEIMLAVLNGVVVYWNNEAYLVKHDTIGQWHIVHSSGDTVGLNSEQDLSKFFTK